jgi:hypothetical protein
MRRCPRCGNEIPDWSGGCCPWCDMVTSTEKRFWKGGKRGRNPYPRAVLGRPLTRPPERHVPSSAGSGRRRRTSDRRGARPRAALSPISRRRKAAQAKQLPKQPEWRCRLDGFNRLLRAAYGYPMWLSDLLVRQGVPSKQTDRWRRDEAWLASFLKRLEAELLAALARAVPGRNPRVVSRWYGLDGKRPWASGRIANEFRMPAVEVRLAHDLMLRYLRRDKGRAALEDAVLGAAQETGRNGRQGD